MKNQVIMLVLIVLVVIGITMHVNNNRMHDMARVNNSMVIQCTHDTQHGMTSLCD